MDKSIALLIGLLYAGASLGVGAALLAGGISHRLGGNVGETFGIATIVGTVRRLQSASVQWQWQHAPSGAALVRIPPRCAEDVVRALAAQVIDGSMEAGLLRVRGIAAPPCAASSSRSAGSPTRGGAPVAAAQRPSIPDEAFVAAITAEASR